MSLRDLTNALERLQGNMDKLHNALEDYLWLSILAWAVFLAAVVIVYIKA